MIEVVVIFLMIEIAILLCKKTRFIVYNSGGAILNTKSDDSILLRRKRYVWHIRSSLQHLFGILKV